MNIIDESEEKKEMFKLEKILDRKWEKEEVFYKIKWCGFDEDQAIWIPYTNLKQYQKEIQEYEEKEIKRNYKQAFLGKSRPKNEKKKTPSKSKKDSPKNKDTSINIVTLPSTEKSMEEEKIDPKDQTSTLKKKRRLERMIDNIIDLSKDQTLITDKTKNLLLNEENKLNLEKTKTIYKKNKETKEKKEKKDRKEKKDKKESGECRDLKENKDINHNKISIDELPGSIERDVPLKILYVKSLKDKNKNSQTKFLIEWLKNKNGITPDPSYVNYEVIKEKYPKILIDYIETKIKIADL